MMIRENYLINAKTVLFYGIYYENGALFTFVIEGNDKFLVAMAPLKLIDKTLISYGSSFKGALESSRKLLGENRKMYPLKIDALLDIWIFPSKSYKKENCVWFALNHVENTKPLSLKDTKVFLKYGHEIDIKMRESSFRNKRGSATDLRDMILRNSKEALKYDQVPEERWVIVEEMGKYECRGSEEER
ncbi:competence protein ComK [Bacillaceae bacterium CLA-AA-H227]|uniref:Competence protein ComK n=1 Tax=Robertmurraya yapensis (ex Hitch et al 2024) TaxID=3133160 RepID=A0ACC6SC06_9BACI